MAVAEDLTFATHRLPFDGSYTELNADGAYALLPAFEKDRILLRQALYGTEDMQRESDGEASPLAWVLPAALCAVILAGAAAAACLYRKKKRKPAETE